MPYTLRDRWRTAFENTQRQLSPPVLHQGAPVPAEPVSPPAPRLALDAGDGLKIKPKERDLQ